MRFDDINWRRALRLVGYPLFFVVLFCVFLLWTFPVERFKDVLERQLSKGLSRKVHIGDCSMTLGGSLAISDVVIEVATDKDSDSVALEGPARSSRPTGEASTKGKDSSTDTGDSKDKQDGDAAKQPSRLSYDIEEIDIDVSLLGLLFGNLEFSVEADALGGEIELSYEGSLSSGKEPAAVSPLDASPLAKRRERRRPRPAGVEGALGQPDTEGKKDNEGPEAKKEEASPKDDKEPLEVHLSLENIELKQIHELRRTLSVPVSGTVSFSLDLNSPTGAFEDFEGEAKLEFDKLQLSRAGYKTEMFGMEAAVPPLEIEKIDALMEFKKGVGEIKGFKVTSKHMDAVVEGTIRPHNPFSRTIIDLYMRFKLLDAFINQSEALKTVMANADMFSPAAKAAHRDDGYYGFRMQGAIADSKPVPRKFYKSRGRGEGSESDPASRRRLRRPGNDLGDVARPSMGGDPNGLQGGEGMMAPPMPPTPNLQPDQMPTPSPEPPPQPEPMPMPEQPPVQMPEQQVEPQVAPPPEPPVEPQGEQPANEQPAEQPEMPPVEEQPQE